MLNLSNPQFVPILFPNDPLADDIATFTKAIGCSDYWAEVTKEYGVGSATATTPIQLSDDETLLPLTGALDDSVIQSWLSTQITAGLFGDAVSTQTVYAIFLPPGVTSALTGTLPQASCRDFHGYHSSFALHDASTSVSYVVVPRCDTLKAAAG